MVAILPLGLFDPAKRLVALPTVPRDMPTDDMDTDALAPGTCTFTPNELGEVIVFGDEPGES